MEIQDKNTILYNMKRVIRFTAEWCGPCKSYAPIFDEVAKELTDVEFLVIDVDSDTTGAAAEYQVRSIPLTVIIDESDVTKHVGLLSKEELKKLILNQ